MEYIIGNETRVLVRDSLLTTSKWFEGLGKKRVHTVYTKNPA